MAEHPIMQLQQRKPKKWLKGAAKPVPPPQSK